MNLDNDNKYQLLDDYLDGGMSRDDLDKFRAFLQSDADLALDHQIVTELKEVKSFTPAESELRSTLTGIRRDALSASEDTVESPIGITKVNTKARSKYRVLVTAMAMAATLLLLFTVFFPQNGALNSSAAYDQFAMVEPLQLSSKSDDSAELITELQAAYNGQEYSTALPIMEKYLESAPRDLDVMLAKGIALTETGQYTAAIETFDHLASLSPRVKKYQWYKAMSLLKQNKKSGAVSLLEDLVATKAYNHKQASKLLATLK